MTSTTSTPTMSTSSSSPAPASSHDDAVANWWEYGSVPLVKRCIREYGWSDKYSAQVSEGYKKFLQLKKDLSDWDHKILSPSIPIDKMWHMHILDITNYIKDCELLCGHLVGHDPDGMLDVDARNRRVETTRHILQNQLGGEMDEEVWNFGSGGDTSSARGGKNKVGSDDESPFRKRRRIKEDTTDDDDEEEEEEEEEEADSDDDHAQNQRQVHDLDQNAVEYITCIMEDHVTKEGVAFKIKPTTKLGKVFKRYAEHRGIRLSEYRFLFEGDRVIEDMTPQMMGISNGDIIDAIPEPYGC